MKINKYNFSQFIVLFLCCFKLTTNFRVNLLGRNSYENYNYPNNERKIDRNRDRNNYEQKENLGSDGYDEINNLEIRNQMYNHNIEPIPRTHENHESENNNNSSSSSNNSNFSNAESNSDLNNNNSNSFNSNNDTNDNSLKFVSRMNYSPSLHPNTYSHHSMLSNFRVASCPCAISIKCQPCGLIPDLDFFHKNNINTIACPCAPKLNCPICPPLSLIHEIAVKKVIYFYN